MPFVARHAERGRLDATSRDATLRSASAHHNRPQTARQPNRRNPIDRLYSYTVDPAGRDLCDAAPLPVPWIHAGFPGWDGPARAVGDATRPVVPR